MILLNPLVIFYALEVKVRRLQAEVIVGNELKHAQEKIIRAVQEMK
jgi:hypothetical protein